MIDEKTLAGTARLFKVLGNGSRLRLLLLLLDEERSVSALAEAAGLSQPLVSQHLKALRGAGLVAATRRGREMIYRVSDHHVSHMAADAIAHAQEHDRKELP